MSKKEFNESQCDQIKKEISKKISHIIFERIHKYQESKDFKDFFNLPYSARTILGLSDFIN